MKKQKYIIIIAIVLIAMIFIWAFPFNKEENKETQQSSSSAINFPLVDKSGNSINLKEYKGKTIVINFWASWCAPCIHEMPSIQEFYQNIDREEVKLVLVALDRNFEKSIAFMDKNNYSMPYYKPQGNIPAPFNVSAIPTTYIINSNGQVASSHTGMADFASDQFKRTVEQVN